MMSLAVGVGPFPLKGNYDLHKAETGFEHKQNYGTLLHSSMLPARCTITTINVPLLSILIINNSHLRPERVYDKLGRWSGSILLEG